jgi:hypothetical protein
LKTILAYAGKFEFSNLLWVALPLDRVLGWFVDCSERMKKKTTKRLKILEASRTIDEEGQNFSVKMVFIGAMFALLQ